MKKFISTFLVAMMMSFIVIPTFAAEVGDEVTLDLFNPTGFYSPVQNPTSNLDIEGTEGTTSGSDAYGLAFRSGGGYASYNISNIEAGTYDVIVNYVASDAELRYRTDGLDFVVDGDLELRSYFNYTKIATLCDVGKIYIPEGSESLKIKNHGSCAIRVCSVTLKYVGSDDTSENITIYAQNATSTYNSETQTSSFTKEVDFYETSTYGYPASTKTAINNANYPSRILDKSEWTRYDISELAPGNYKVTVNYSSAAATKLKFSFDEIEKANVDLAATGTIGKDFADAEVGNIFIGEDTQYLKVENSSSSKNYVISFTFEDLGYYDMSFDAKNATIIGNNKAFADEDYCFSIKSNAGTVINSIHAVATGSGDEIAVSDLGNGNYSISKNLIRDNIKIYAEAVYAVEVNITSVTSTNGEVVLSVNNSSGEQKTGTVYVASYMGNQLSGITTKTYSVEAGDTQTLTASFDTNSFDNAKAFIWSDLTEMIPVASGSSKIVGYTSQYLGDGFSRLNLKDTVFKAETEREFYVDIKEDGEYTVFLNQTDTGTGKGGYAVRFEKDEEVIELCDAGSGNIASFNGNYIRANGVSIKNTPSGSVALSKGMWKMYIKSYLENDISFIDVRSTIISVGNEGMAIYPSDYNYFKYIGGGTYVNKEINETYRRSADFWYYADYATHDLDEPYLYGRKTIVNGTVSYKLDVKQTGTYRIKNVIKITAASAVSASNKDVTYSVSVDGGEATVYTHSFNEGDPKNKTAPTMYCDHVVELSEGIHELTFVLSHHRAHFYHLEIEPYIEEMVSDTTEDGAEFILANPEVIRYVNDAKKLYPTKEYADYGLTISGFYGLHNQSHCPPPVSLKWDAISGAESYTLYVSEDESFEENVLTFANVAGTEYDIYNLYTNSKYYWKVVGDNNEESDVKYFTTKDTVRFIYAPNGANIRDIGGWNGLNQGMAYRGAHLDGDVVNNGGHTGVYLTEEGIDIFVNDLKMKTDLDLRGDLSSNKLSITQIYAPITAYMGAFTDTVDYATAFRAFADINNYPIYFHCTGGADRTGTVALIVEALCGASEEDLSIDYELTAASEMKYRYRTRTDFIELINTLKSYSGDTLQEKVENYLMETLGLTRQEVSNIQSLMSGNKVVLSDINDFAVGENTITLNNLNENAVSRVVFNGEAIDATVNGAEIAVTFAEAGTGEIVFNDGTVLRFVVTE